MRMSSTSMLVQRIIAVGVGALVLGGCQWLTGPDEVLGSVTGVEAPDTVAVGTEFSVTVLTSGPTTCWKKDHTVVAVDGLAADIWPYDVDERARHPHIPCFNGVVEIVHSTTLSFDRVGAAQVKVHGREGTGGAVLVVIESP